MKLLYFNKKLDISSDLTKNLSELLTSCDPRACNFDGPFAQYDKYGAASDKLCNYVDSHRAEIKLFISENILEDISRIIHICFEYHEGSNELYNKSRTKAMDSLYHMINDTVRSIQENIEECFNK